MIDKQALIKAYKDGKITSIGDINEAMKNIVKEVIETLSEQEITSFLGYEKHHPAITVDDNYRNGHNDKTINSKYGHIDISIPRDRKASFAPELIKKRQTDITGLEDTVISLYAKGMSTRDIQEHIESMYGHSLSIESVSNMTNAVLERAKEWQIRPLESIYAIIFMDATFLKIRVDGAVRNIAAYLMIGVTLSGTKEVVGIWMLKNESSKQVARRS